MGIVFGFRPTASKVVPFTLVARYGSPEWKKWSRWPHEYLAHSWHLHAGLEVTNSSSAKCCIEPQPNWRNRAGMCTYLNRSVLFSPQHYLPLCIPQYRIDDLLNFQLLRVHWEGRKPASSHTSNFTVTLIFTTCQHWLLSYSFFSLAFRYPFTSHQVVPPLDWEQYVSKIATDILT
jgi:hypothetical protein